MASHSNPKCTGGVWSPYEIETMKSLIRRHNNSNKDIVDVLQEHFSYKEKHEVTDMYVDIVVEMMQKSQPQDGGMGGNANNQPAEEQVVDNTTVVAAPLPQPGPVWYPRAGRYWTREEHMYGY